MRRGRAAVAAESADFEDGDGEPATASELADAAAQERASEGSDPVRTYLAQMGRVALIEESARPHTSGRAASPT